jgi:hypothetical protein
VEDYVDTIPNSAVTVLISPYSGSTSGITSSGITLVGIYTVTFTATNGVGLTNSVSVNTSILTDATLVPSVIFNTGYDGPTFTVITGLTESDFRTLTISGISTNVYDPYTMIDSIQLSGMTFPTDTIDSPYTVTYDLVNYSDQENIDQLYRTKTVYVS